jgi:hypothetical protein
MTGPKKMEFSEAIKWKNIDKKSLTVAVAGGFVAGLTMGAASALTAKVITDSVAGSAVAFVAKNVVGGAVANVAAGQTEAVVEPYASSRCLGCWEYNENGLADAKMNGFQDWRVMKDDAAKGAAFGLISGTLSAAIGGGSVSHSKPPAPWIRAASTAPDTLTEFLNRKSSRIDQ